MGDAVTPAVVAVVGGVVIGLAAFAVFVAISYRRYGRLEARQVLAWFGFVIYFLAIWTYTLLPLPAPGTAQCVQPQLDPLFVFTDVLNYPHSSFSQLIRNPVILQNGLNVVLFMPLGLFVRALFGRGWVTTVAVGACWSLFVETTQLTGVWGLYECAYRVFDVDDLLTNTLGALIGGLIVAPLPKRWFAPKRLPHDEPAPVTLGRRLVAMACDGLVTVFLAVATAIASQTWQAVVMGLPPEQISDSATRWLMWGVPLAVQALCIIVSGRSVGDLATELRWEPERPNMVWHRFGRFVGGIGGFQLLGLPGGRWSFVQGAFVGLVLVLAVVARSRGGLPGLLSGQVLADARGEQRTRC
ncbi:MAG: VanZ family protein [Bifidobacteriaceae bacterium]|jgi:glycopeptide antibiotics resistance protein|nr:VanZ family protein [Bifidobacteriaceae bacterium]